ncbi:MAG: hypothetical protein GY705_08040 [Bacteroidetes bacterium]|nr:hypothetical protein [Bacteroidota bacterium]
MEFFRLLEKDIDQGIQKILHHPFLDRIKNVSLSKSQLQFFAKQYYIYCTYFPRFLAAVAGNIPDDKTRMPIIQNIWEEHGSGDLQRSHRALFLQFAKALDITTDELKKTEPLASTQICVENLINLCHSSHFLESLGALGPGTEFFTSEEYELIADGLRKYDFLDEKALEFWTIHIALDVEHYSGIVKAMEPWVTTQSNRYLIKVGAKKAIDLELLFWEGLEDNLPD